MSRYLGPRLKLMRAVGMELPGLSTRTLERRPYRPGQHGLRRRKVSAYAIRLAEKQKLRWNYGLTERQLRNLVRRAATGSSNTGERLIELLEARLDNAVFRAGFAPTIPAARQLVNHGHITVDERRVTFPGYSLRRGQRLGVTPRGAKNDQVAQALTTPRFPPPPWLAVDAAARAATLTASPDAAASLMHIDHRLVVEFYAQRS
jgi:small subunit ribosomal protein S4